MENTETQVANRIASIVGAVRPAANTALAAKADVQAASAVLQDQSSKQTSTRMTALVTVAATSQLDQWAEAELTEACSAVLRTHNDSTTAKTLETFLGELKAAGHPRVRAHVPFIVETCALAWNAEDKQDHQPCRKAFVRQYAMTVRAFRAMSETGVLVNGVGGAVAWAESLDPNLNVKKVLARLAKIREDVQAFQSDWPIESLSAISEYLGKITKAELNAARAAKLKAEKGAEDERMAAIPLAPIPAVVQARVAPTPTPASAIADILGEAPVENEPNDGREMDEVERAINELEIA